MGQTEGKNDLCWNQLFEKYHILESIEQDGLFKISANQIKEFREPRLMTKFDHHVNLPRIFQNNNLSILPITRGDYLISTFNVYSTLPEIEGNAQIVSIPSHLESLAPNYIRSEAIALNAAYASGIFQDFLEEDSLIPTVSGRMSSGDFSFQIETHCGPREIMVHNSQIEIDAAYEGRNTLAIIEAKQDLSPDFLVRQLYYPFRLWESNVQKSVKPVFFVYTNGMFALYQFEFETSMNYNSLHLVRQKKYRISTRITKEDLRSIIAHTRICEEPEIAFPQANSLERIVNLLELLAQTPMTKQEITANYAFNERQTNYYSDAGRYLGLIKKERKPNQEIRFSLTDFAQNIMQKPLRERHLSLAESVLKHRVFHEAMCQSLNTGNIPSIEKIVEIMKTSRLFNVGADSTFHRRASTVIKWIQWLLNLSEN